MNWFMHIYYVSCIMRLTSKLKDVSPNYEIHSDLASQLTFCLLGLFSPLGRVGVGE